MKKLKRTCLYCNKEFEVYACLVKKGKGIFCSVLCSNTHKNKSKRSDHITGSFIKCKFCKTFNLQRSHLIGTATGRSHHKGWKAQYID